MSDFQWVTNPRWSDDHVLASVEPERHNANSYGRTLCGRRVNLGALSSSTDDSGWRCPICRRKTTGGIS